MKAISLFAGIGGFDLAMQRFGITVDTCCEIDKNAQNILRRHFPKARLIDDVRKIGKDTHERGTVDVICGGFPCQDLSIAGKRAGLAGERSGLWWEYARIIDELEPRWVVAENVPGLLSSNKGRDFAAVVQWLAERGYGVSWRILDAQYFGVAQRRRRVFIVASLGNGRCAEVLFEREGVPGNTPPRREAWEGATRTVAQSLTNQSWKGMLGNEKDRSTPNLICVSTGQANAGIVKDGSPSLTAAHEQPICFIPGNSADARSLGETVGISVPVRGGGGGTIPTIAWEMSHASEAVRESGEIAPTLQQRMGTGGNQVPMVGIRRLTPTECERLQGFPDGWTDGQADSVRYRQLGNAVAVPVVEWIIKRLVKCDEENPCSRL